MVHSNTKNAKSRVRKSQVCYLSAIHKSALNNNDDDNLKKTIRSLKLQKILTGGNWQK